jgi:biopolymer transport protein ExbB
VIDILVKGGVVMIPIILASLAGVAIIVERLLYYRRIGLDEKGLVERLRATLERGRFDEALAICESSPSPITTIMKAGIENRHRPAEAVRQSIEDAASLEVPKLERYLSALGTVATIAPLLGLLGTVTGIIRAFGVIGRFGSVGDPALLARGIAEALVTTAAGLIVSIPATIFYNYLVGKANHTIIRLENRANELQAMITGEPRGARR